MPHSARKADEFTGSTMFLAFLERVIEIVDTVRRDDLGVHICTEGGGVSMGDIEGDILALGAVGQEEVGHLAHQAPDGQGASSTYPSHDFSFSSLLITKTYSKSSSKIRAGMERECEAKVKS